MGRCSYANHQAVVAAAAIPYAQIPKSSEDEKEAQCEMAYHPFNFPDLLHYALRAVNAAGQRHGSGRGPERRYKSDKRGGFR